jgi:hypothetical protein
LSFLRRKLDSYAASSMLSRLGGSPHVPRVNAEMKSCIEECLLCYQTCLSTAMGQLFGDRQSACRTQALQLDHGLRRDLSNIRARHVDRLGTSQTHLSLLRRDLRTLCSGL